MRRIKPVRELQRRAYLIIGLLVIIFGFTGSVHAGMSHDKLEKERLSRYCINYAGYLIDVGRYLDALDNYQTAIEVTTIPKTKGDAMLAKATLLASFLDAPKEALKVYRKIRKIYKPAAEIAIYREGLLLFTLQRYKKAKTTLRYYLKTFRHGKFRFQTEALLEEITRMAPVAPPAPKPSGPVSPVKKRKQPDVRVRICHATNEAIISGSNLCMPKLGCKSHFILRVKSGKLIIDHTPFPGNNVNFESNAPLKITCGRKKKRLRGKLVASVRDGKLLVINVLGIEDYLLSVVPSENPASWPLESLKAQAVAARTYAYYQILHRKNWAYDLVDYAGDQAYGGIDKENPRSTKAVQSTTGEILMYDKKPILAMFTANSGGYTADSQAIFDLYKPYLVAHRDPASLKGRMADWTRKFTASKIVKALDGIGVNAAGLESIGVGERGPSGRVVKVRLILRNGGNKVLRNRTTLRRALDLPEILYGVHKKGNTYIFNGHGWGHGVGYSQWGAEYMGKTKNYKNILSFYYGKTKLKKLWR